MSWTMVSVACVAIATLAVVVEAEPCIKRTIKKVDELFEGHKEMKEKHNYDKTVHDAQSENEYELVV